jgi:hypothetical protein
VGERSDILHRCRPLARLLEEEAIRLVARIAILLVSASVVWAGGLGFADAEAAAKSCKPVVDPYAGSRYEGVNLSRIRADGLSCSRARHVARRAHYKALGLTPPPSGIRRFSWHGWSVIGDLRPSSDTYLAVRDDMRVRWRF